MHIFLRCSVYDKIICHRSRRKVPEVSCGGRYFDAQDGDIIDGISSEGELLDDEICIGEFLEEAFLRAGFGIRSRYNNVAFESLAIRVHRSYVDGRREGDHELIAGCGECGFEFNAECKFFIAANERVVSDVV